MSAFPVPRYVSLSPSFEVILSFKDIHHLSPFKKFLINTSAKSVPVALQIKAGKFKATSAGKDETRYENWQKNDPGFLKPKNSTDFGFKKPDAFVSEILFFFGENSFAAALF